MSTRIGRGARPVPLVTVLLLLLVTGSAFAQAPSELLGLAGGAIRKFERSNEQVEKSSQLRASRARLAAAEDTLRNVRARVIAETKGAALTSEQSEAIRKAEEDVDSLKKAAESSATDYLKWVESSDLKKEQEQPQTVWLPALETTLRLAGEGDLRDRLISSGRLLYDVPFNGANNTHLTVFGNIGSLLSTPEGTPEDSIAIRADAIRNGKEGIVVGLCPWYNLYSRDGNFSWAPNLSAAGRTARIQAPDGSEVDFDQIVVGAGLGVGIGFLGDGKPHPMALSLSVDYSQFEAAKYEKLFGRRTDHLWTFRWSTLIPISAGSTGVLIESETTRGLPARWQAGFTYTKSSKQAAAAKQAASDSSGKEESS